MDLFSNHDNPQNWKELMDSQFIIPYLERLEELLRIESKYFDIYPSTDLSIILKALDLNPANTKAIIIGQDPYPNGNANGLAFSSDEMTPSLEKLEEAFRRELGNTFNLDSLLRPFQDKILLLNSALTVRFKKPGSHKDFWKPFIIELVKVINWYNNDILFFILGTQAQKLFEKSIKVHRLNNIHAYVSEHPAYAARKNKEFELNGITKLIEIVYGKESPTSKISTRIS